MYKIIKNWNLLIVNILVNGLVQLCLHTWHSGFCLLSSKNNKT